MGLESRWHTREKRLGEWFKEEVGIGKVCDELFGIGALVRDNNTLQVGRVVPNIPYIVVFV